MLTKKFSALKWWQIALLTIVVSAIGGLSGARSSTEERKLYDRELKQAPWAPPGWLFAPAWALNNFFLLLALQRILKMQKPDRKKLLFLQAMIWIVFFSFGYIYFNKKSPVLAAIWTISDTAFAAASCVTGYRTGNRIHYYYLPLLVWTMFASTVAGYQALKNPDPVFDTKALLP